MSTINAMFAQFVHTAAKEADCGDFGGVKVFISDVYDHLSTKGMVGDLETFKETLFRVYKLQFTGGEDGIERVFTLSRADLSYEHDQKKVERSKIENTGSTFHCIRID